MGSAVSSVFGGGGSGGILGAIGGIVGGIFGGPLGAMIGQAIGGMLQQAIGNGANSAVDTLVKEHGMPKFLGEEVKGTISKTIAGQLQQSQQGVSHEAQGAAQQNFGGAIKQWESDFANQIVQGVLDQLRAQGGGSTKGSKGATGGGWLQAIASVMGQALGNKAKEMVNLSQQINDASAAKAKAKNGSEEQAKQADEFNKLMTQFQATSQEYNYLNSVFTTALKGLGEALSSMARKQ
ncbi:hypothetical protein J2X20_003604 [Pelomonas saccharophila]|uniref:Uncharacterized protein n=1 Tax=Roseateles saccharophilus TaxID=304 RepID=A0ABU1YQ12_ROSSA|nr:hypothetical protein [Roseateles saccharophilus]MDR7270946.1 hypothetical protein [Roseateles saccharophilus]